MCEDETKMVLLFLFIIFPCSCLNQCTYCKTKHARGDLGSYPPEEIVARAKQAFEGNEYMCVGVVNKYKSC